jgi:hypothetical protein
MRQLNDHIAQSLRRHKKNIAGSLLPQIAKHVYEAITKPAVERRHLPQIPIHRVTVASEKPNLNQ